MPKPDILIFHVWDDWDLVPKNEQFTVHEMPKSGDVMELPEAVRHAITAFAFKGHSFLGAEIMDAFPNLGMIANYGVGYDTIDVAHATSLGIKVSNTPDVLTTDVADLGIGLMIAKSRDIVGASHWVRSGNWSEKGEYPVQTKVSGKTAGIVGLGRIGRAVGERLVPFGMDIHYYARAAKDTPGWTHHTDIAAMAQKVDFLFVTLSGGPDTAGMIDASVIKAVGPKGLLINISRGSTVDEAALLEALEKGALGAAALDVFQSEPNLDPRFLALDNVLLSPHQSSGTIETRQEMGVLQRANLQAFFDGKPLITPVN
ncbi:MAG: 2-hydroxyacid dehydrogenase [Pseudomonadota bacterium]